MYSDEVIDHFRNPRNMGKLDDYSAIGKVGNIACGDVMWLYIKVDDTDNDVSKQVISDISWETFGCTAAIATSSMVSELAKGKSILQAIDLTNKDVADRLGGLPPIKMHCSALAADALNEAIYNYLEHKGQPIPDVLTKRHKHLQEDLAQIEKRYAAFAGKEDSNTGH